MGLKAMFPDDKQTEQSIVSISAKIADAVEMVRKAKEMTARSERILIKVQLELEELCVALGGEPEGN